MQKRLRAIVLADLLAALEKRGYYKVHPKQDPCLNWKRSKFHVIVRPRGSRKTVIDLHIHVDLPTSLPPYHHAVHKGQDLRNEINRIIDGYHTIRGKIE